MGGERREHDKAADDGITEVKREEQISLSVAAEVTQVLPNGNLVVKDSVMKNCFAAISWLTLFLDLIAPAFAQQHAAAPANPSALLNAHRDCTKYDFGTGFGRWGTSTQVISRVFDPVYPNGDRTLAGNSEFEIYDNTWASHVVKSDHLELTASLARGRTVKGATTFNSGDIGSIVSAMLSTRASYHYGYFEIRAQVPPSAAKGAWFAFWLTHGKPPPTPWWPPEVDAVEVVDNSGSATSPDGPGNPFFSIIQGPRAYRTLVDRTDRYHSYRSGTDLSAGYHVYGIEWLPDPEAGDRWRRMLDGVVVSDIIQPWVYADGRPAGPAHLYINLAYGGKWAGRNGVNPGALPTSANVDYFLACGP